MICVFAKWVSFIKNGTPNEGTRNNAVDKEEVVRFYTEVFRNPQDMGLKATDSMKAAEFFSKYYNMLDKDAGTEGTVVIVDDIRSA